MVNVDVEIDAKGLYCPMPIVKLKKATKTMTEGQVIKIVATDPGSKRDIPAWANKTGAKVLETNEGDGTFTYIIRV
ncbi:sulfurtransferase TusA family protein [archaeon]|nr:sulfurtransferase TusA family protein [archaeon]